MHHQVYHAQDSAIYPIRMRELTDAYDWLALLHGITWIQTRDLLVMGRTRCRCTTRKPIWESLLIGGEELQVAI